MKQGLHKYGLQKGHSKDWDLQLPWLAMGYNLVNKPPLHHFHHILYCSVVILNYQPPCDMMLWQ